MYMLPTNFSVSADPVWSGVKVSVTLTMPTGSSVFLWAASEVSDRPLSPFLLSATAQSRLGAVSSAMAIPTTIARLTAAGGGRNASTTTTNASSTNVHGKIFTLSSTYLEKSW